MVAFSRECSTNLGLDFKAIVDGSLFYGTGKKKMIGSSFNNPHLGRLLVSVLLGLIGGLYMTTIQAGVEITDLDPSWNFMLGYFFEKKYQHGVDVIFNFGPLGFFASSVYSPELHDIKLFSRLLYNVTVAFGLAWAFRVNSYLRLSSLFVLILFVPFTRDLHIFLPAIALVYNEYYRNQNDRVSLLISFVLAADIAAASLIKSSGLMIGASIIILFTVKNILRKEYFPGILIVYIVSMMIFLLLSHQDPGNWLAFLRGYLDISRAYNADMGIPGAKVYQWCWLVGALVVGSTLRFRRVSDVCHSLAVIGLLLVTYKASFVRQGDLPENAALCLAFLALAQIWIVGSRDRGIPVLITQALACVVCVVSLGVASLHYIPLWPNSTALTQITQLARENVFYFFDATYRQDLRETLQRRFEANLAKIRADYPFSTLRGPVDAFPFDLGMAYASGLPLAPRPAFQAYFATSRRMTERNAAFWAGETAAQSVLFTLGPIDGRYPTLEDPLTWRALRRYYAPAGQSGDDLLLRRTPVARTETETCRSRTIGFDETVPVPAVPEDQAVWARITVRPTWFGRLAGLVLTQPMQELWVTAQAGPAVRYRFLREAGEVGFLLSPVLPTPDAAAAFFGGTSAAKDAVTAIRLTKTNRRPWFRQDIAVEFCSLAWT